ncbi:MAG: PLP-dependent cysteine synthase family protein [Candidatus Solibacter usitatus]|nr:PLP-dependent cysteine synthase family protein [Candidatus Solibacter usitatus]
MWTPAIENRFRHLHRLIGNTPLLEIGFEFDGQPRRVFAKSEQLNMTGSIKDRMALHILESAYREGRIEPGDMIVEATSGNTGISFSALGRALGHPVTIFMPDWMSRERTDLISSFGASIVPVSRIQGGFLGSIRLSEELASRTPRAFLPCQFSNAANAGAHQSTTGPEIWFQMEKEGLRPDAFVAGVGTGGTVMGVGRYLRSTGATVRVHPLEPAESPTLSTGYKVGSHRIQGISDEFIPAIVNLDELDSVVAVADGDSILMAQRLASELGFAVGISSGANFLGALMIQNEMGPDAGVVTVFSDDNKKYLTTDLLRHEPEREAYLSPRVKLTGFRAFSRNCQMCNETAAASLA